MLAPDPVVTELPGRVLRVDDRLPRLCREPLEHQHSFRRRRKPAAVLLVHGLLADAEGVGDLLPRPPLATGVLDLELLERLEQDAQRGDGPEPDDGIAARGLACELGRLGHSVNVH